MSLRRAATAILLAGVVVGGPAPDAQAGVEVRELSTARHAGSAPPGEHAPPSTRQLTLDETSRRFAALWAAGDAGGVESLMSAEGVRLNLDRSGHAALGARQATAALRAFHEDYAPGSAAVHRLSNAEGDPPRGFAEVGWQTRTRAGEEVAYSLFVVFLQEGAAWRVSEIRVLR